MKLFPFLSICLFFACSNEPKEVKKAKIVEEKIFTEYSTLTNQYANFNSVNAINKIADIENEYFRNTKNSVSKYYGTVWREQAEHKIIENNLSQYQDYLNALQEKPDSLHCTLYAYEGLKAGLTKEQLEELENKHRAIWKSREIAGWSIGYILVKDYDWQAYLILNKQSNEYNHCLKSYKKDKSYPVWKQPNIPLEEVYIIGEQDSLVHNLLNQHEFGWGFSEQGIHTWITRFDELKECNWLGSPSVKYQSSEFEKPLFISTSFKDYFDYNSHVVIFPRKKTYQIKNE